MIDKIKERLAFARLNYSLLVLAVFGIVGWMYGVYEKLGFDNRLYTGFVILVVFMLWAVYIYFRILTLHKKL